MNNQNPMLQLEVALTQSAFAHEYALLDLKETASYIEKETIMEELEQHRARYFSARNQLAQMNPEKLALLEDELRFQKEILFNDPVVLH